MKLRKQWGKRRVLLSRHPKIVGLVIATKGMTMKIIVKMSMMEILMRNKLSWLGTSRDS